MTSTQTLQGKVAFVQGGSRGIGAAIVKRHGYERMGADRFGIGLRHADLNAQRVRRGLCGMAQGR